MKNKVSCNILTLLKEGYDSDQRLEYKEVLDLIRETVNEVKQEFGVTDKDLYENGAIFYMNANDGTEFDWKANYNTCEFQCYYKEDEMGMCKLYVTKDNQLTGYKWSREDINKGIKIPPKNLDIDGADFALLCKEAADDKGMYDQNIDKIDWESASENIYEGQGRLYFEGDEEDEESY